MTRDGTRSVNGLSLSLAGNKVSGDLVLDDSLLPLGTLTLEAPDIGPLAALAGQTAAGDVQGSIRLSNGGGAPTVAIDMTSGSISRRSGGEDHRRQRAGRQLSQGAGDLRHDQGRYGHIRRRHEISGIGVDLKRDGDWTGFSGGATVAGIPATAEGRVRIADGTTSVEIASGDATIRGIKAAIAQPSSLSIANGRASIEKLMLDVGGGSVTVSGTAGPTLDLAAEFSGLPAALANDFSPGLDAAGTLGGTAQVAGPSAAPDIRFDAPLSGAETSQTRQAGLGPLKLDAAGSFSSAGGVAIDRATLSGDKISGKAAGTINPNGASDFSLDLASTGPSLPLALGGAGEPRSISSCRRCRWRSQGRACNRR